jgi:hypothetical protein
MATQLSLFSLVVGVALLLEAWAFIVLASERTGRIGQTVTGNLCFEIAIQRCGQPASARPGGRPGCPPGLRS